MTIRLIGGPCDGKVFRCSFAYKEIALPVIVVDGSTLRGFRADWEVYQHVRGEVTVGQESQHEYRYVGRQSDKLKLSIHFTQTKE